MNTSSSTSIATHIFNGQNNASIRTILKDGEPWFIAKDVAEALGYKDTDQAIRIHCKKTGNLPVELTGNLDGRLKVIPESDVYRLIFRSSLESAEAFEDWVVEQVLPSLRKHGGYITGQETLSAEEQRLLAQSTEALARLAPLKLSLLLAEKRSKATDEQLHQVLLASCMSSVMAGDDHTATLTRAVQALHQEGLLEHAKKRVSVGNLVATKSAPEDILRELLASKRGGKR